MTIRAKIESLILEGLPIDARHGQQVKDAVERELTRLLEATSRSVPTNARGEVKQLSTRELLEAFEGAAHTREGAPQFQFRAEHQPSRLGRDIAHACETRLLGGRREV
jgi:hypothetical protein